MGIVINVLNPPEDRGIKYIPNNKKERGLYQV